MSNLCGTIIMRSSNGDFLEPKHFGNNEDITNKAVDVFAEAFMRYKKELEKRSVTSE